MSLVSDWSWSSVKCRQSGQLLARESLSRQMEVLRPRLEKDCLDPCPMSSVSRCRAAVLRRPARGRSMRVPRHRPPQAEPRRLRDTRAGVGVVESSVHVGVVAAVLHGTALRGQRDALRIIGIRPLVKIRRRSYSSWCGSVPDEPVVRRSRMRPNHRFGGGFRR